MNHYPQSITSVPQINKYFLKSLINIYLKNQPGSLSSGDRNVM